MSSPSRRRHNNHRKLSPPIEALERRQLLAGDPSVVQPLPYTLEFDHPQPGIVDKDGTGTGFTYILPNKFGNEYQPQYIDIRLGASAIKIGSPGGTGYEATNTLVNGVLTTFNASTGAWTISMRIKDPAVYLTTAGQDAGLFFGYDMDNFVKLTMARTSGGVGLHFFDEQKFRSGYRHSLSQDLRGIGSLTDVATLDLMLSGSASTGHVKGLYSINGAAPVDLGTDLVLTGDKLGAFFHPQARAGLILEGPSTNVYFDRFEIRPGFTTASTTPKVSVPSRLFFNDVRGGGTSKVQAVDITNTGNGTLTIPSGGITLSGTDATQFTISGQPSGSASIAPGKRLTLNVAFKAGASTAIDIKTATISVKTNDPTKPTALIRLRGLPTTGTGGTNEPSLARILELYQTPINVGDSNPADVFLDDPPKQPNDEVTMQSLLKAGPGAVWIQPIAVFGVSSNPAVRIGYYEPGSTANKTELFTVATSDAQTVDVDARGSTSFDPGSSAFALYSVWPGFKNTDGSVRTVYEEDVFNTAFDTHSVRHLRFYPWKNTDGSILPNTFVMAYEEFNAAYDNQDFVAVIHNVKAAPGGPEIGTENLSGPPAPDRLVFNRFMNPDPAHPNTTQHNVAKLRVRNTGSSKLVVSSMDFPAGFSVTSGTSFTVNPGRFIDVTVVFTGGSTAGFKSGNLVLHTNDADEPLKTISMAGYNQPIPEANVEPTLPTIGQMFGLGTVFVYDGQTLNSGGKAVAVGDEVLSPYWVRADTSLPVHVRELAAFYTQGNQATLKTYPKGTSTTTNIFTIDGLDTQTLYPRVKGLTGFAEADFTPSGTFGFRVDNEWSDDTKNPQEKPGGGYGHHMRFFTVRDSRGFFVPNTWIMTMDYNGINYDFEDNIYLISNMRPEALPATVSGLQAFPSSGIQLDWADASDAGLKGYNVYRSTRPSARFSLLNSTPLTVSEFLDTTATRGVQYYYRVAAVTGTIGVPASASAILA